MMGAISEYCSNIKRSILTIADGMAVTLSYVLRKSATIQYPDRTSQPVVETLPERSRGILEVDLDLCTGCQMCSKQCPIECIRIDIEKNEETKVRSIHNFTIDVGKCMYCGLCVESCNFSAIRHSHEFEGSMGDVERLKINFVTTPKPVAKGKKDEPAALKPLGSIVREFLREQWTPADKFKPSSGGGE